MENGNNNLAKQISLNPLAAQALGNLYFESFLMKGELAGLKNEIIKMRNEINQAKEAEKTPEETRKAIVKTLKK